MSVLVCVDSDPSARSERGRTLRAAGFSVRDAESIDALKEVASTEPVDAIVIAWHESVDELVDVCRALRDEPATAGAILVVAADALDDGRTRAQVLEAGAALCVPPPSDGAEVAAALRAFQRYRLVTPGELGILRDAAEHHDRVVLELQRATALLDLLFADAPIGFGVWDRDLRFIRLNPKLAEMDGLPVADHIGRTVEEILPHIDRSVIAALHHVVEKGEAIVNHQVASHGPRSPGKQRYWSLSYYPVKLANEVAGVGMLCEEITAAKLASAERERLLASERAARTEAELANRLKDEFLATLSHELRTPLNAIMGWTHMLRNSVLSPEMARRAHDAIARSANVQSQLVADLLDVSRIITGKLRLDLQPVSIPAVLDAVLESVRPALQTRRIRLETSVEKVPLVMADPARLQQVIWNLMSNAIKFTDPDGCIDLTVSASGGRVEIGVRDTGKGIAPEFLPYVFDRFRQADGSTTRQFGGLGLGLAIVRHLVELHGGSVRADSPGVGRGATFTVALPAGATLEAGDEQPADEEDSEVAR